MSPSTPCPGKARAIYLSQFDSFDELQKANKVFDNPAIGAEFERLNVADGELLEDTRQLILSYVPGLSYHPKDTHAVYPLSRTNIVHVRPGHEKEFEELVKLWMAAAGKAGSSDHWEAYRLEYGDQLGSGSSSLSATIPWPLSTRASRMSPGTTRP